MRASLGLVLVASLAAAPRAAAQDAPARRELLALDERATAAWLYRFHVPDADHRGVSRAESMRALGHAAALLDASQRAAQALRTAGADEPAALLEERIEDLAGTLCPELPIAEARRRLLRRREHARLATECATTRDLIGGVGLYADRLNVVWEGVLERAPHDCVVARRVSATHIREALDQLRELRVIVASLVMEEERRELLAELRAVPHTAAAIAAGSSRDLPTSLSGLFPPVAIVRYELAAEDLRSPDAAVRRRAVTEVSAAARALVSSPNPRAVELRRLRAAERQLERALAAWRSGASEASVVRKLDAARGTSDRDEVVAYLTEQLRDAQAACSR